MFGVWLWWVMSSDDVADVFGRGLLGCLWGMSLGFLWRYLGDAFGGVSGYVFGRCLGV